MAHKTLYDKVEKITNVDHVTGLVNDALARQQRSEKLLKKTALRRGRALESVLNSNFKLDVR